MYKLIIEFENGCIEEHIFNTKEEVEEEVEFQWAEVIDFYIGTTDSPFFVFWEDRFDFGW